MKPIKHNKQPNRIIYFGTDGCVGHYPLGINFHLTRKEYKDFQNIDRIITDEFLNKATGTFFRYITNGTPYIGFGVPYSPDDERPGSKTIVLVECGTVQKVIDAILQNSFLLDKFKKVKEKYNLYIYFFGGQTMSIEDIKNCECVSFSTSEPMDNIDSAEWFKENILPDDVEITYDDNNYFEVCVEGKSYSCNIYGDGDFYHNVADFNLLEE